MLIRLWMRFRLWLMLRGMPPEDRKKTINEIALMSSLDRLSRSLRRK